MNFNTCKDILKKVTIFGVTTMAIIIAAFAVTFKLIANKIIELLN